MSYGYNSSNGNGQYAFFYRLKGILFVLFGIGIFSLFIGTADYRFRGEEPTRLVMAYEMYYQNNFAQPTYLGEEYYRKPPLINWLILGSSTIFGWDKFTGRIVSILATFLTALIIFWFSKNYIFYEIIPALLSSVIFLSFIDIAFWYGFLAEIDMTLTLIVISLIFSLIIAFEKKSFIYFGLSGFLTGLAFLLKGFPAFVFWGATYLALMMFYIFKKQFSQKLLIGSVVSIIVGVIPVSLWIINLHHPIQYLSVLWEESFGRVQQSKDFTKFFSHLLFYPILNLKQALLISFVFFVFLLANIKNIKGRLKLNKTLSVLVLIFFINYLPYWISAGARGRYILPLMPIIAIFFAYFFVSLGRERVYKVLVGIIAFTFITRILIGLFYFPYETQKKGYYIHISQQMIKLMDKSGYDKIASDCEVHKGIIFYLDIMTDTLITSEKLKPNWKYFISCNKKQNATIVGEFRIRNDIIRLYQREK